MMRKQLLALLFLLPFFTHAQNAPAVDTSWVRNNYTKTEHAVAMRDGVKLYTVIYTPKDGQAYPVLMQRTPYSAGP